MYEGNEENFTEAVLHEIMEKLESDERHLLEVYIKQNKEEIESLKKQIKKPTFITVAKTVVVYICAFTLLADLVIFPLINQYYLLQNPNAPLIESKISDIIKLIIPIFGL